MRRKKRTTYRSDYNINQGYIASRKVLYGKNKNEIIVLYDNRDGQFSGMGKYVFVNETRNKFGYSVATKKQGLEDLKMIANGILDYKI
jgi:hypothetical protein